MASTMKKSAILGLSAFALLSLAACNKETEFIPTPSEITITATRDDSAATRTVVQSNGTSVWWSPSDQIDMFCGPGETPAVFTGQNSEAAATATFKGELAVTEGQSFYGIYPSSRYSKVDENGLVSVYLPDIQQAVAGTFAPDVFPAVAVSENTTLSFRSVAGGIKFSVADETIKAVVIRGNRGEVLAGVAKVNPADGSFDPEDIDKPAWYITITPPEGGFKKGESYYAIMLPTVLSKGITILLKYEDESSVNIITDKSLEVKRGVIGKVGTLGKEPAPVERVWGLFSTESAAWNEYYGGKPDTDRNVAMDDNYIYVAETRTDAAKLWAISIEDPTDVKAVNVEGVDGGFWKLACPRVINDESGNGYLLCSNMNTTGEEGVDPKLYIWWDGIDSAPTAYTLQCSKPYERIGDTWSFWGTLSKGMLLMASTSGNVRMWKFVDKILSNGTWVDSRYVTSPKVTGVAAYFPFPDDKNHGMYAVRDNIQAQSAAIESGQDAWTAPGGTLLELSSLNSNYFLNATSFQYIPYNGKKYLVHTRQVGTDDGRIIITEGESSDSWSEVIAKRHQGQVLYQAAIQEDAEMQGEYETSPRHSGNSGMDLAWRIIDGKLYIACVKQNVGLSLFRVN